MQIHELQVAKKISKKRIGRGGKKGTYSGRGMKGQKSRSGSSQAPTFEGGKTSIIQMTKKSKGFKALTEKRLAISLDKLELNFKDGDKVNNETLKKHKLIRKEDRVVKILSDGEISKKLTIENLSISKKAQEKIEKAGGIVKKESSSRKEIEKESKTEKKE